jgi:hypothetical protein
MAAHSEKKMRTPRKLCLLSRFNGMRVAVRIFRNVLIVSGIVLSCPSLSPAQHTHPKTRSASDRMYCYQKVSEPGATGGGLVQVNGFTVEVKPAQDPESPNSMTCRATIRSAEGKIVFEHDEWGIEIDPITGKDVNGDGYADAVLVSFSGGAHCCWTYHIVSLGKNPGLIVEFENRSTASFEDLNGDGRVEILIRNGGFDEGFGLSHPFSPFPLLIVRLNGTKFEDVDTKFWPVFEKEIRAERSKIRNKYLREFLKSNPYEIHDSLDYLDTEYRVLAIVLDYLYAGREREARGVLGELWPVEFQGRAWEEMVSGYCSGLRARLELSVNHACRTNESAPHR